MSEANAPVVETDNAEAAPDAEAVNAETQTEASETTTSTETAKSWRDMLPEDIRENPSLAKFETAEGFAKSYINLEKLLGSEKIPVPKTDEDWDNWYKAAGRPDSPDGYQFEKPENIPAGMEYSEELDKQFAQWAHEDGLNGRQAQTMRQRLLDYLADGQKQAMEQSDVRRAEAEANLKAELGRAYDQNLKAANAAMKKFAGDEFAAFLDSSGLGDHPAMVKAFAKIAKATMGENELIGETSELTMADLDQQIADFNKKYATELLDKTHADHAARVKQRDQMYRKRFDG